MIISLWTCLGLGYAKTEIYVLKSVKENILLFFNMVIFVCATSQMPIVTHLPAVVCCYCDYYLIILKHLPFLYAVGIFDRKSCSIFRGNPTCFWLHWSNRKQISCFVWNHTMKKGEGGIHYVWSWMSRMKSDSGLNSYLDKIKFNPIPVSDFYDLRFGCSRPLYDYMYESSRGFN